MPARRRLDAAAVRRWCTAALVDLRARRQEIDDINVYPVPDGDAGTNMVATMEAVETSLRHTRGDDLAATMKALARGALVGARGNSGVILSQVLSGFADVLGPLRSAGGETLKDALDAAVSKAYAAVSHPAEGTILTVAKGAARSARAVDGDDFAAVIRAAAAGAREALDRTTEQLPALKAAGVVDAGGRGLVVVLEALARVMGASSAADGASSPPPLVARDQSALVGARESGSAEFGYEVQFLLDAPDNAVAALKKTLAGLGDSLVVVGGHGLHNVHVHVNDVGAVLEAAVKAGRPHRVAVTRFADQIAWQEGSDRRKKGRRAIVAVGDGDGLCRLLAAAGAVVVAADRAAAELAGAVDRAGADEVLLLPNSAELLLVAAQVRRDAQRCNVHVIPTRSAVQGLAALAVHDPDRGFADDVIAMSAAAGGTQWGEVSVATHEAQTSAGPCRPGDVLGLVEGEVVVVGDDASDVAQDVVGRMLSAAGELVTVVAGVSFDDAAVEGLIRDLQARHPVVQIDAHRGEQHGAVLLIGVE